MYNKAAGVPVALSAVNFAIGGDETAFVTVSVPHDGMVILLKQR